MSRRTGLVSLVLGAALLVPAARSFAQDQPAQNQQQGDRGNRGQGGDRGNWQDRLATYMKEQLQVNDDEWKVIQPKLTKVYEAKRDTGAFGAGMFGGRGGRGGPGGGNADQGPQSAAQKAVTELRTTLDKKDASADEIAAKLKALREAREAAKKELATAQKELKDILTQRQEAVLVMMGQLD